MEELNNGFMLNLCSGAFPLSTDSIALAHFVRLPKNAKVLDIGSGCGTLGLLLCAKCDNCSVTGIEICREDHNTAIDNAEYNHVTARLNSICADATQIPSLIKPGSYRVCVSNPPYFTDGPQSKTAPTARRDDLLSMDALFKNAAWSLCYGGDFFLVHRPERLGEIFACGGKYALEPKTLQLLRHKDGGPIVLVLVQFRKGGKPGLKRDEQFLYQRDGTISDYYKKICHLQET